LIRALGYLLVVATVLCGGAKADNFVPQVTLRQLGGRPVWVPICSRRGVNGSAAYFDPTNTAVMDQVGCYAPSWGNITAVKLVYATFDISQAGEVDRPVSATVTASVFQPSANTNTVGASAASVAGATTLSFSGTALGANAVSVGQTVATPGSGYLATGTYVAGVSTAYAAGSNAVGSTTVTLSTPTIGNTSINQLFTFAGSFAPVRFAGNRSVVITPGHDVVTSDPAAAQIPAGGLFFVRTAASFSGTGLQLMDYPGMGARIVGNNSEFDSRSVSLNDQTGTPVTLGNSGGGYWCPVMVLGLVTPNPGALAPGAALILGDSIASGTGDQADWLGLQGYIQRSLENNVPFVTAARGSTLAFGLASSGNGQYALSVDAGITDILLEHGRNDIQQFGVSATALETLIKGVAARYGNAGKRVWCFTIPPTTISSDGFTTLANQSWIQTSYTASSAVAVGANAIPLSGISNVAVGQNLAMPPLSQIVGVTAPQGSTSVTLSSVAGLVTGQAVYGPGIAAGSTITGLNGLAITLSTPTSGIVPINAGLTFGTGVAPGTTITAVNVSAKTITLSKPSIAAIASGATIYTGSQTANPAETQRQAYNSFLRTPASRASLGCSGLVDDDRYMADPGGSFKWRVDLGAASVDGVHPNGVLHQAVVNAGIISPTMFVAR
jgi:hypothetical protein